jgi:hypothetical protein
LPRALLKPLVVFAVENPSAIDEQRASHGRPRLSAARQDFEDQRCGSCCGLAACDDGTRAGGFAFGGASTDSEKGSRRPGADAVGLSIDCRGSGSVQPWESSANSTPRLRRPASCEPPTGEAGRPTLVNPVRNPCWPVMKRGPSGCPTRTGTHLCTEQSVFWPDQKQDYGGAKAGWQPFFAMLEQVLGPE